MAGRPDVRIASRPGRALVGRRSAMPRLSFGTAPAVAGGRQAELQPKLLTISIVYCRDALGITDMASLLFLGGANMHRWQLLSDIAARLSKQL